MPFHPRGALSLAGNRASRQSALGNTDRQRRYEGDDCGEGIHLLCTDHSTVINNTVDNSLTNNGAGGVALHNHAPVPTIKLANNVITANYIAGNGADTDVTTLSPGISLLGTTTATGTLITLNQIEKESIDIVISNAAGGAVFAHLNNLIGRRSIGVDNLGAGAVDATENWWGCARGPGASGCTTVSGANVTTVPFLTQPVQSALSN